MFNVENNQLEGLSAEQRLQWVLENMPGNHIMTTSFGAQSAVLLHMVTQIKPDIPVVMIDTGYLFPETYKFADDLTKRLNLNLKTYQSLTSSAWQETKFGKLWEKGLAGIEQYNEMNKLEPMRRALSELDANVWISGIRRSQASTRANKAVLEQKDSIAKLHPIIDWNDKDIYDYLVANDLPYHPLWDLGYVSIGDRHSSSPLLEGMKEEDTRFFGLKRECGLHE